MRASDGEIGGFSKQRDEMGESGASAKAWGALPCAPFHSLPQSLGLDVDWTPTLQEGRITEGPSEHHEGKGSSEEAGLPQGGDES